MLLLLIVRRNCCYRLLPFIMLLSATIAAAVAATPLLFAQAAPLTPAKTEMQAAPSEPVPPPFLLKLNVPLVVLDLVVTDKTGKPVDGLTASDLQVFEDGNPQRIRSFETSSVHTLPSGHHCRWHLRRLRSGTAGQLRQLSH